MLARILTVGLALVLLPVAAPTMAQTPGEDRKVSLSLRDVPFRSALDALFQGSSLQYGVDPNVENVRVTLTLREISFPAALRLLVRQVADVQPGAALSRDADVYLIRVRSIPPAPAAPVATLPEPLRERKVTVSFREVPLRSALDALFQGSGVQYAIGAGVPNVPVTLVLRDITLQQALRLTVRQAAVSATGLGVYRDGDVLLVRLSPP